MRRIERRVELPVPPQAVFELVTDPARIGIWQSGIQSVERASEGPMAVGERITVVRELIGQRVRAELEVRDFDPPRHASLGGVIGGVDVETGFTASPLDGGGSLLQVTVTLNAPPLVRFLEGVIADAAERDVDESIERLRAQLGGDGGNSTAARVG